jgi:hypothetical protein
MVAHFYGSSPSGPDEQEARLRPLALLLRAWISFVVIADDVLSIVHRALTCLFEMQLLVPENPVSTAARVLCTDDLYCITEPGLPMYGAL